MRRGRQTPDELHPVDGYARRTVLEAALSRPASQPDHGLGLSSTLRWIRLTGGMPSLTGKDPAGHMLLIRDRFPEIYARTYKFLNVLDYLNLRPHRAVRSHFRLDPDLLGDR